MAGKMNASDKKTRSSMSMVIVVSLCCCFYILGAWQRSGFGKGDSIALEITKKADCTTVLSDLSFESHHGGSSDNIEDSDSKPQAFMPCDVRCIHYTPCQYQMRAMTFPRENMIYREKHCLPESEKLGCIVPAPNGYVTPFSWPKSRDYVFYANVPYKSLTVENAV